MLGSSSKRKGKNVSKFSMMNDEDLNLKIKLLVKEERELLNEILIHIREVDRRKLFLRMAYASLFDYLTDEVGYSASAAQRRIDAARLAERVPEVLEQIKEGTLNLTQVSKVQHACRQIKKASGESVPLSLQREVLKKLENQGALQTDLIVSQHFGLAIRTQEKLRIQTDESVRVELTFTKEEMILIERARALLSNKTGGVLKDTILELARKAVEPKNNHVERRTKAERDFLTTAAVVKSEIRARPSTLKSITPKLRREILKRDGCCQFRELKSGKVCGSKFFLEVDHVKPKFAGGGNEIQNLRALCKNHNLFRYREGI